MQVTTPGPLTLIDCEFNEIVLTCPLLDGGIVVTIESSNIGGIYGKWDALRIDGSEIDWIQDGGGYGNVDDSCGLLRATDSDLGGVRYGNVTGTGRASDIILDSNRFRGDATGLTGVILYGVAGGTIVGNKFRGFVLVGVKAVRFEKDASANTNDGIFCGGNSYDNCAVGVSVASGALGPGTKIGPDGFDDTVIEYEGVPGGSMSYAHTILDGSFHTDSLLDAVTDGDIIIGNVTPKWSSLAISIPAANVRNVLGVDTGELRASWKTALDATLPATLVAGGAGAAGTSLVFSHRDHNHPAPATWPPGVHTHAHGDLTGVTADQHHAGFVGLIINGPSTISPDANDLITIEDTASVTWASSGAGKIAATAVAGGGGNMATDPLWDAAGDLAVGTGADTGARLVLTVPAATFFNVLGVLNAETTPTWKALFDATVPTTIAPSDAAATGSAVAAARRDHLHGAPATFPAMAHDLDGASHTGVADYTSVLGLTSLTIGDANFGLIISVGNPALTWDTGDFIQYVRASNYWSFAIGGANMGHIGLDQFRLTLDGTVSSPDNAFALYIGQIQLDPANGWAAFGLYGGGTVVATAGETVSAAYGIYSEAMAKSGSGTITTAYGLYVVAPTIGTTNIGALIGGQLVLPVTGSTGGLLIGGDVNLYRSAANVLYTPDNLLVQGYMGLGNGASIDPDTVLYVLGLKGAAGVFSGLSFNIVQDVNANDAAETTGILGLVEIDVSGGNTKSGLVLGSKIVLATTGNGTIAAAYGYYAKLNQDAGQIDFYAGYYGANPTTIGTITAAHGVYLEDLVAGATNYGIYFAGTSGLARQGIWWNGDTNLYRSSANVLKTDDGFAAVGHGAFGGAITTVSTANVLYAAETFAGALGATAYRGAWVDAIYNPNAATTGFHAALRFDAEVLAGNNNTFDWLIGIIGAVKVRGTGAKAHVIGLKASIFADENNAVASDVIYLSAGGDTTAYIGTSAVGVWGLEINNLGLGFNAISGEVVAIEILPQNAKGGTAAYGLQIGDITNATTVIPIYQQGTTGHNRILARTVIGADRSPGNYALEISSGSYSTALFEDTSADSEGARMDFKHLSASPAAFDIVMGQHYYGYDSAVVPNLTEYGTFRLYAKSITDGTEQGLFEWLLQGGAGSLVTAMQLDYTGQLKLPIVGANAGVLVGGDTQLYRGAADVFYSPDSLRLSGHVRIGNTAAPTNVTAGDLTVTRLIVGDAALGAGVDAAILGDGTLTGFLRIGSATAPTNTTAGDLTCVRLFVGDAAAVAGKEALITGDMAITGTLVIGTAPDYTVTNVTTDRTYDANATTLDEVADVLGTLIADLTTMGLLQ